ncbi:MAG: UDPGP type 1 family protein [Kiritimatiellae bacterium]|nr:UDPGP type 1 family protein [Kiritimatiellia bacterium]
MTLDEAKKLLAANGQEHVLKFYSKLSAAQKKALLAQIESIDFAAVKYCRETLAAKDAPVKKAKKEAKIVAPKVAELKGKALEKAVAAGEKELAAGRVAVLLVAGGQGSRLGFDGPKGCYEIGPVTGAPLFYFHARKVLALTAKYEKSVPFYIMTSEANYEATVRHFDEHNFFGLDPEDVIFFKQGMWPGMTDDGKIILDAPGHIFMSPDGHGGLIASHERTRCFKDMKKRGVKSVYFFQVDNPLVEVADPAFIGHHVLNKAEYSLKVCAKRDWKEGLGVPVKKGSHFEMIEYTELSEADAKRTTANGELYFKYGSPAIHVFDRAFLEREAKKAMPLHLAHKKIQTVDAKGKIVKASEPNGWKFEKFIFDILPDAKSVTNVAFDRADEFAPVKNAEGSDSPATCQAALKAKWAKGLAAKYGITLSEDATIEVDPIFELDGSAAAIFIGK